MVTVKVRVRVRVSVRLGLELGLGLAYLGWHIFRFKLVEKKECLGKTSSGKCPVYNT